MQVLIAALVAALCTIGCDSEGGGAGGAAGTGGMGGAGGESGAGGGEPAAFAITVSVSGLSGTLVLQNNGGDALTTTENGEVTFETLLADGASYAVTVGSGPPLQGCIVTNGEGTVTAGNISDVVVRCAYLPFFQANDGVGGSELWKTDGTSAGTQRVKDIWPGANGSDSGPMLRIGDLWFLRASDGTHGSELWASDGTEDGTRMVMDIQEGPDGSSPQGFAAFEGLLFFAADDGLNGQEVWMSDGTQDGTQLLVDLSPTNANPRSLTAVGSTLYFVATDPSAGHELRKTDGTAEGTALVKDILLGSGSGGVGRLTAFDDVLYFRATRDLHLWRSEGTSETTSTVTTAVMFVNGLTVVESTLFFSADDAVERELWKSDGTSEGTELVHDIHDSGDSIPEHLTNRNGLLFFRADDGENGVELWASDGTTGDTALLSDIWAGDTSSSPIPVDDGADTFGIFQDIVVFFADDGEHGLELWKSDGTPEGTVLVKDINEGPSPGKGE
ncbi:MAG: hypothetical protein JRJ10_03245 [Deltaproteobacteria bacterium]|nr:hypothetical protein [Deltaproteobacteria bacterium]